MQTLREAIDNDARRFACGILSYMGRHGEWPLGSSVNQLASYKSAPNKAQMVENLVAHGWMEIIEEPGVGHKVRRRYVITDLGLQALMAPDPIEPDFSVGPTKLPSDPVEQAIYAFHMSFFQRTGRWPDGGRRGSAFGGLSKMTPARRREGYERLIADGRMVNVTFLHGTGQTNCYVIPLFSPEYVDKHGMIFYAPLEAS